MKVLMYNKYLSLNTLPITRYILHVTRYSLLATCYLLLVIYPGYTAFEETSIGARAVGLGGGFTAQADDVYAIKYNPAGLSLIPRSEISTNYGQLYTGLTDESKLANAFVGIAYPIRIKTTKSELTSGKNPKKDLAPVTTPDKGEPTDKKDKPGTGTPSPEDEVILDFGTVGLGWLNFSLSDYYSENSFILSYGKQNPIPWLEIPGVAKLLSRISVGGNIKVLSLGYGQDAQYGYDNPRWISGEAGGPDRDTILAGERSKYTFAIDLGLQYVLADNYRLGLAILNVNQPNLSLSTENAVLSAVYKLGLLHERHKFTFNLDLLVKQFASTTDIRFIFAAERWFPFGLGIRASAGLGSRGYTNFAVGTSYRLESVQVDYAWVLPSTVIKDTWGEHRVSLTVRFGPVLRTQVATVELQEQLAKEVEVRRRVEEEARTSKIQLAQAEKEIAQLRIELDRLLKVKVVPPPPPVAPAVPTTPASIPSIPAPGKKVVQEQQEQQKVLKEKEVTTTPVPETKPPSVEEEKKGPTPEQQKLITEYQESLSAYRQKAASGTMSFKDRIWAVRQLITKFSGKGIEIKDAEQELSSLNTEKAKIEQDYEISLKYYQRLVSRGIGTKERVDLLNRILEKYRDTGIDLSQVETELKQLEGQ